VIAAGRPFLPLFLHVVGAMTLAGATLAVLLLASASRHRPSASVLARSTWRTLVLVALPAWVVMRVCAQWIYSREGFTGHDDPTWISVGFDAADLGLLVLLAMVGAAYWWQRTQNPLGSRLVTGLASAYLLVLAVAWLAMSGKWS
jgi:hypothetical protein